MTLRAVQEGVVIAFHSLRQSKVRTGLTVLGVAVGVLVVVVMSAFIHGIDRSFDELVEASGPNTFYVVKAHGVELSTGLEDEDPLWRRRPGFDPDHVREIESAANIVSAYPMVDFSWFGMSLSAGDRRAQAALFGVTPEFARSDQGEIVAGRWFTGPENAAARPLAVIDSTIARDLFGRADAVGERFRIGSQTFEVVGTYARPANLFAGMSGRPVYVPFEAARKRLLPSVPFMSFNDFVYFGVVAQPEIRLASAVDQVTGRLRALRNLGPGEENNFDIVTQDEMNQLWSQLTGVLFVVMFALSSVGLMVGGVGVIAVMVVSVTERTREIGIRKALGATRRDVLWQFLVEAVTLTTVGGAFGLLSGGMIAWAVTTYTPLPASIPLWSIGLALTAAALTGILFGIFPAMRAARLDPVAALRYE